MGVMNLPAMMASVLKYKKGDEILMNVQENAYAVEYNQFLSYLETCQKSSVFQKPCLFWFECYLRNCEARGSQVVGWTYLFNK